MDLAGSPLTLSRNNAIDGYWSIGKLRSLANEHGQATVLLDMLTSIAQPPSSDIALLMAHCYRLIARLAKLSCIPLEEIAVARIAIDFAPPPWPRATYYKRRWGDQFTVTVMVDADGRATGMGHHAGYCRSHDPAREGQATRPADG